MIQFPHQQFAIDNNLDINDLPRMLQKRILGFEELQDDLQHTTEQDKAKLRAKLDKLSYELEEDLEQHFEHHLENNDVQEEPEPEVELHSELVPELEQQAEPAPEQEPFTEPVQVLGLPEDNPETQKDNQQAQEQIELLSETIQDDQDGVSEQKAELATESEPVIEHEQIIGLLPDQPETQKEDQQAQERIALLPETPEEVETKEPELASEEPPSVSEAETPPGPAELTDQDILEGFVSRNKPCVYPIELLIEGFKGPLAERIIHVGPYKLRRAKHHNFYTITLTGG